ncbi:hypothetical protein GCM10009603_30020 [Nocardiopsis exhalans]
MTTAAMAATRANSIHEVCGAVGAGAGAAVGTLSTRTPHRYHSVTLLGNPDEAAREPARPSPAKAWSEEGSCPLPCAHRGEDAFTVAPTKGCARRPRPPPGDDGF